MKSREAYRNKHQYFLQQRIIVLFIFILFCNESSPQSYPFRHYTAKDGLPSSEVYHVFQDSKGYIWFATGNGVSRYDGYEFRNFTHNEGLPDNTVFEIFEDSKNRIWFMPHSIKLSYFYNDSIYKYKYNDTIQIITKGNGNPVKQMFYVDSSDNVYFRNKGSDYRSIIIDSLGRKHIPISEERSLSYDIINNFLFLHENKNKPARLDSFILKDEEKILRILIPFNIMEKNTKTGVSCGIKKDSNYFIVRSETLLHVQDSNLINIKFYPEFPIWISTDKLNNLWVGTRNGIYCYHNLNINTKPTRYLKGKNVSSVLSDNEGGYWFSTLQNGVYYLPNIYSKTLKKKDGLKSNIVTVLEHDSTTLWIGSNHNSIQGLTGNRINKEIISNSGIRIIYDLLYNHKKQNLWIGSNELNLYTKSTHKILEIIYPYLKNVQARDLFIDINGDIWVGSYIGLIKYSEINKKIEKQGNFRNKINALCQTPNNKILIGCHNGLWEYSKLNNTFNYLGNNNELLKNKITCITHNKFHDNYWVGTGTDGIIIYNTDSIYNISIRDGLSNNNVTSLFFKNNVMWVTTNNGLNKITLNDINTKSGFKVETYNTIHGIASNEINDIYVGDSLAYIATQNGLTILDYNYLNGNTIPPPIRFKKIKILNSDTLIHDHYNLPYYKNSINIEYVGLMYRNNEKKKYKYQLNTPGKPANWIETPDNYVNLSYLSPGKYNFSVIAINEDGYESNVPASLSFTINPPYWKTWWFRGIIFLTGFLLIYIFYRLRIHEVNKRNNLEKKLLRQVNKFRQQALSQQMNPHFIFNTLNSIQFYIFKNDNSASIRYLAKFSKLMRIILDNSQHDTISLQRELDAMDLYMELESLRLKNSIEYKIKVHENVDTKLYQIYPLLIQPYVENSIWHGLVHKEGKKRVKIELEKQDDYIKCTIEDNGIGREKAMEIKKQKKSNNKSHGINITGKRIDMINKLYNRNFKVEFIDLKDKGGKTSGTRVILQIPIIWNEKFNERND